MAVEGAADAVGVTLVVGDDVAGAAVDEGGAADGRSLGPAFAHAATNATTAAAMTAARATRDPCIAPIVPGIGAADRRLRPRAARLRPWRSILIDRLVAGAGAVSATIDRVVRRVLPGSAMSAQPVSLLVAAGLGVVALVLAVVGLGSTGSTTLQTLDPAVVASATDLGDRIYATVEGRVPSSYVESYADKDSDGIQDAGETGQAWDYFLLAPGGDSGLIVRSERPPSTVFTFRTSGVIREGADYIKTDIDGLGASPSVPGLTIDPDRYIDARVPADGAPLDLSADLPAAGTAVSLDASRLIEYFTVCSTDPNRDGICSSDEVDLYDVIAYDPVSRRAIVVVTAVPPAFQDASFTGVMRKDPRSVAKSIAALGTSMADMGLTISPTYLLEDGSHPADPTTAFLLAIIAALAAAVIVVGVVGGYVRFRAGGTLPPPGTSLAPRERVPTLVTGLLRGADALVHVREASADVVRFVPEAPDPSEEPDAPGSPDDGPVLTPPTSDTPAEEATTLVVERRWRSQGVALGIGELTDLVAGTVVTFRARRPGLRATAGTGPLILSFATEAERDRIAAELLDETGIGAGTSGPTVEGT